MRTGRASWYGVGRLGYNTLYAVHAIGWKRASLALRVMFVERVLDTFFLALVVLDMGEESGAE